MASIEAIYRITDGVSFTISSNDAEIAVDLFEAQREKRDEGVWTFAEPALVTANEKHL